MSYAPRPARAPQHERVQTPAGATRYAAALPGWLLLVGGLALVALGVLTPQWLENERLAWRQTVLTAQTAHLTAQAERYTELHQALAEEDPVLLERVAFVELGLKPVGKTPLLPAPAEPPRQAPGLYHFASAGAAGADRADRTPPHAGTSEGASDRLAVANLIAEQRRAMRPVTDWPIQPLPRAGRDLPVYEPPNTRLTRLTQGQSRLGLIAAGLLCLVAACYPGMWEGRADLHEPPDAPPDEPPDEF